MGPLEVNQHVVARCRDGKHRWSHKWFPGVVRRINEDGTVAIDYEDGDQEERVPRKHACRREEEQALPTTLKLTGSGRRSTETDRLSSSKLGGELQYGKRMVKPLKSTPKRRAQERKEACVSPSCIQNLLGVLLLVRPTPAEEEEEEQEEGEVKLIGSRIRVYWTVAKAWYAGRVISAGRGVGGILHTVAYDDRTRGTHHLLLQGAESSLNETWMFEPPPKCKTPAKAAALKLPPPGPQEPSCFGPEWVSPALLRLRRTREEGDSRRRQEAAEEAAGVWSLSIDSRIRARWMEEKDEDHTLDLTCLAWPPKQQPSSEQEEEHVRPALSVAVHDSDSMPSMHSSSSSSSTTSGGCGESDEAEAEVWCESVWRCDSVWCDREAEQEEERVRPALSVARCHSDPMPSPRSASPSSTSASGWGESDEDEAGVQAEAWAGVEAEAVPEAEEDDAASVVSGWDYEAEDYEAEDE